MSTGVAVMGSPDKEKPKVELNNVRNIREGLLMSKAELARRAKLSVLTIDRVEKGMACRMDTKRKIILSLGLKLSDRDKVFKI
jgi:DNA-binding XRE family transcriptional regulator